MRAAIGMGASGSKLPVSSASIWRSARADNAPPVIAAPGSTYAGSELGRSIQSQFTLAKDLVLTFNGTGTAPTTGKVVVTLLLTKSQRLS